MSFKLRNTKKDKQKNTFDRYGKYTNKASRIKEAGLEKLKEKQSIYKNNNKQK